MANPLASSISKGKGSGEAAFLGESSFDPVKFTEGIVKQEQTKRLADQKQGELDMKSLLDDDFKANWDIDALNTFQPRIDEFRNGVLETFSAQKGRLTPAQKIELNAKKKRLQEDILLSNKAYEAYNQNVQGLKSAILKGGGELDVEESEKRLGIYKDPMSVPELASEIQGKYGGSVTKWRMDNALNYGLVPSFSREEYIQDLIKSKDVQQSVQFDKDASGKPIAYTTATGKKEYRGKKGISDEQLMAKVKSIYTGTDTKSQKTREEDMATIEDMFTISPDGTVAINNANDPISEMIYEKANIQGLSNPEQIKKELAKNYTFADLRSRFPYSDVRQPLSEKAAGRSGGGGGGWDSKYSISVTDEPEDKTGEVKQTLGITKFPTAPGQLSYSVPNKERGDKYVSITRLKPSGTSEEEAMTLLNGKPIKIIGFKVSKDGEVLMDYAYKSNIQDFENGNKEVNLIEKGYDIAKNAKLLASISSSFGTEDKQFNKEEFLDFLRDKAGIAKKQKTKTQTKANNTPNKGAKGKKDWSQYKRK
jgi:hypothetical protein